MFQIEIQSELFQAIPNRFEPIRKMLKSIRYVLKQSVKGLESCRSVQNQSDSILAQADLNLSFNLNYFDLGIY